MRAGAARLHVRTYEAGRLCRRACRRRCSLRCPVPAARLTRRRPPARGGGVRVRRLRRPRSCCSKTACTAGAHHAQHRARPQLHVADWRSYSWESFDGLEIEGLLAVPRGNENGALPLVVYVHGGPTGTWSWSVFSHPLLLAQEGYAVLLPNPRGSVGAGRSSRARTSATWAAVICGTSSRASTRSYGRHRRRRPRRDHGR